jgi:hypothetical protein
MMTRHQDAHPLIPGYAKPTADGIRWWATKQMYQILRTARPAQSVGVYVGVLVPSGALGAVGKVYGTYSAEVEDHDDL